MAIPKRRPCPNCPTKEPHYRTDSGAMRCPDCGHVSRDPSEPTPAPVPTGYVNGRIAMRDRGDGVMQGYMGPAPGYEAIDTELLIRHTCSPTDVIVRRRAGVWTCTNCGSEWSSAS